MRLVASRHKSMLLPPDSLMWWIEYGMSERFQSPNSVLGLRGFGLILVLESKGH